MKVLLKILYIYSTCEKWEPPLFLFFFFFFLQVCQFGLSLFLFFIFLRIFTCLLYSCNISLYCIHTKSDILYTFEKKYDKYCTNFANVYNIYQFLCVYNLYIKRANRLMKSYFNWFSELSFFLFFF